MNFVFNRDRVVASTSGHVIGFKKNVPTYVPPEARKDVLAAGGAPEDEDYDPDAEDKKPASNEPTDPGERQAALFAAFTKIVERNERNSFTAGGQPHQKALAAELGWSVNAKERDAAWEAFQRGDDK
jgi:hypothetical protein